MRRTCAVVAVVGQLHMGLSRTGEGGVEEEEEDTRERSRPCFSPQPSWPAELCSLVRIAETFGHFATSFITFSTNWHRKYTTLKI